MHFFESMEDGNCSNGVKAINVGWVLTYLFPKDPEPFPIE